MHLSQRLVLVPVLLVLGLLLAAPLAQGTVPQTTAPLLPCQAACNIMLQAEHG